MLKSLILTVMTVATAAGVLATGAAATGTEDANQPKATITLPTGKTSPASGKQMYRSYCASCHGLNGKGNGPIAASLKTPPADLTELSRNNGGKYPWAHVTSVLEYGVKIPSHGTADMPVWGPVLGKMDQANSQEKALRITNLSKYLETMQAK
ncbi:MAG TPA: c-type cytochrome [Terracidiphilus sp.]|nr:c-type cytochrome [Terracidiphilus sp.]HUX28288.1 c-type cytochrome [Terracidiphilus sp.]